MRLLVLSDIMQTHRRDPALFLSLTYICPVLSLHLCLLPVIQRPPSLLYSIWHWTHLSQTMTPWHSVSPVNHPPVYILYMQGRSVHVPCCVYCFSGTQQPNGKIWNPPCNDDTAMEWNTSLLILSLMTKTMMLKQRCWPLNMVGICFEKKNHISQYEAAETSIIVKSLVVHPYHDSTT